MHSSIYDEIKSTVAQNESEKLGADIDSDIDSAILNLIIMERLPLLLVDSKHLKRLVHGSFSFSFFP